jgi:ATP-dependent protease ClpP protease subunit
MTNSQIAPIPAAKQAIKTRSIFYISYFDQIDMVRAKAIMGVCANILAQHKPDELYFLFSSPGGDVNSGIVLYNYLCALPVEITMHNIGAVDSIGNVVFSAGNKKYAAPYSSFLFHGISAGLKQDQQLSLTRIKEIQSSMEADQKKIAGILQANSKLSEAEILKFFSEGEAKDAAFAKEKGIVHDIIKPNIHREAPHITINVN